MVVSVFPSRWYPVARDRRRRREFGWRAHTTGAFTALFRPGDHYFIERERPFLVRTVREQLLGA